MVWRMYLPSNMAMLGIYAKFHGGGKFMFTGNRGLQLANSRALCLHLGRVPLYFVHVQDALGKPAGFLAISQRLDIAK